MGRRGFLAVRAVVVWTAMLGALLPQWVEAEQTPPASGPLHERIAVQLIDVGKVDTAAGTYSLDFYLAVQCDRPCAGNDFTYMNGQETATETLVDEPQRHIYRKSAALNTSLRFDRFPFDTHTLYLGLEPKDVFVNGVDRLVYVVDSTQTGVSALVDVAGWDLAPGYVARVDEHTHPLFGNRHYYYEFRVTIRHALWGAFFKTIFPPLVIMLTAFLAFLLRPDKNAIARLGINTATLSSMILFHISITSSLPPLGYLTFEDKFMIVNYVVLILALGATVIEILFIDWLTNRDTKRVESVTRVLVPALWLALQVGVLVSLVTSRAPG